MCTKYVPMEEDPAPRPAIGLGDIVELSGVTMRVFSLRYDGGCNWWLATGEPLESSLRYPIVEQDVHQW